MAGADDRQAGKGGRGKGRYVWYDGTGTPKWADRLPMSCSALNLLTP